MSEMKEQGNWVPGQAASLAGLVAIAPGSVVSRTLVKREAGTVTIFAFDAGQGLSEHSAPFDALVFIVEGEMEIRIGGVPVKAPAGNIVLMPANIPHALQALQPTKMLLTMVKG